MPSKLPSWDPLPSTRYRAGAAGGGRVGWSVGGWAGLGAGGKVQNRSGAGAFGALLPAACVRPSSACPWLGPGLLRALASSGLAAWVRAPQQLPHCTRWAPKRECGCGQCCSGTRTLLTSRHCSALGPCVPRLGAVTRMFSLTPGRAPEKGFHTRGFFQMLPVRHLPCLLIFPRQRASPF